MDFTLEILLRRLNIKRGRDVGTKALCLFRKCVSHPGFLGQTKVGFFEAQRILIVPKSLNHHPPQT